jgi:hypothetical protein
MADYPSSTTPIKVIGRREVCEVNGRTFSRIKGTDKWTESIGNEPPSQLSPSSSLYVSLVHQRQGPGEPSHWSLIVAPENKPGYVYQVKGDTENMRYQPSDTTINIMNSISFLNIYHLAPVTEEQGIIVRQVAEQEPPPRATNRHSVTENCQGWTVRVIAKLVESGMVPIAKLEMARSMLQPV